MLHETKTVHPYELRARSAKTLLQRLYRDVNELVGEEVDLAKAEVAERSGIITTAARTFAYSIVCGLLGLGCLSAGAVAALASVTGLWPAAAIVGVAYIVAAFALRAAAKRSFVRATEPALSQLGTLLAPPARGGSLAERQARVEWTRRQVTQTISALEHKSDLVAPIKDTVFGLGSLGVALSAIARSEDSVPG